MYSLPVLVSHHPVVTRPGSQDLRRVTSPSLNPGISTLERRDIRVLRFDRYVEAFCPFEPSGMGLRGAPLGSLSLDIMTAHAAHPLSIRPRCSSVSEYQRAIHSRCRWSRCVIVIPRRRPPTVVIIPGVSNCVSPSSCPGVRPVRPGAPSEGCTCRDRSGRTATRERCAACGVHTAGRARPCARFYARGHAGAYAGASWVGKVRLSVRPSVGAAGKDGA